jgi:hypothetical protein
MNIAHDQALVLARRLIQRLLDEEAHPDEQKPAPAAFELAQ